MIRRVKAFKTEDNIVRVEVEMAVKDVTFNLVEIEVAKAVEDYVRRQYGPEISELLNDHHTMGEPLREQSVIVSANVSSMGDYGGHEVTIRYQRTITTKEKPE